MTMNVYGIPNCDTVKKARKWLTDQGFEFKFIDFKKSPPTPVQIKQWVDAAGIEVILNKRGTTWRKLDDATKAINDESVLINLMSEQPSMIKRPIIEFNGQIEVGFTPKTQSALTI
jgi:arsenate reductase